MARLIKDISFQGQKAEFVSKAPSKTLILPGKEVVQVIAKVLLQFLSFIFCLFESGLLSEVDFQVVDLWF
jgi:hypothetical protein